MQTPNCFNELRSIEAGPPFWELNLFAQMSEQLAAVEEVHHKVEFGVSLECVVKLDDERTINLFEDVAFSYKQGVTLAATVRLKEVIAVELKFVLPCVLIRRFLLATTSLLSTFIAKGTFGLSFFFTRYTLPNEPRPTTLMNWKSSLCILVFGFNMFSVASPSAPSPLF